MRYKEQHQLSANATAMPFNIPSAATVSSWLHLYNERGAAAFKHNALEQPSLMSKSIDIKKILKIPLTELNQQELLRRAQYLEAENAYLKKLEALARQKNLASKSKSK